jgi:hypothetical protein
MTTSEPGARSGALAIQLTGVTRTVRGEGVMDTPVVVSYA